MKMLNLTLGTRTPGARSAYSGKEQVRQCRDLTDDLSNSTYAVDRCGVFC